MILSLNAGRVQIPPALQGGFLGPVLNWLQGERESEAQVVAKDPVFANVDP